MIKRPVKVEIMNSILFGVMGTIADSEGEQVCTCESENDAKEIATALNRYPEAIRVLRDIRELASRKNRGCTDEQEYLIHDLDLIIEKVEAFLKEDV